MPSIHSLVAFATSLLSQFPLSDPSNKHVQVQPLDSYKPYGNAPSCPKDGPVSCHNSTVAPDACCFIYPGGQILQTQFWDTNPSIGPEDSWTIHGLWPDLCDGTYPQYCTSAPQYHNITSILAAAGQAELLLYMQSYWRPNVGTAEHFWQHEWNKHGTCVNTLAPGCYGDGYKVGDEVVDFFLRAVGVFKTLDTYTALASSGILPSTSITYTSAAIQEALTAVTGSAVYLGCRSGRLTEVWYSFNVKGSLQAGDFVPTAPAGKGGRGSCPARGVRYLPK